MNRDFLVCRNRGAGVDRKPDTLGVCLVAKHPAANVVYAKLDALERCVCTTTRGRLVGRGERIPLQIKSLMSGCN
eukprot:217099-Prymnesium_polylepis.1